MSAPAKRLADVVGEDAAEALACWALDALVAPPVRIDTATTRISAREVKRGREILEEAGLDWRGLKADLRSKASPRSRAAS